jgi:hypothetical protein
VSRAARLSLGDQGGSSQSRLAGAGQGVTLSQVRPSAEWYIQSQAARRDVLGDWSGDDRCEPAAEARLGLIRCHG